MGISVAIPYDGIHEEGHIGTAMNRMLLVATHTRKSTILEPYGIHEQ